MKKDRIIKVKQRNSRIGSYAIASSIMDCHQQPCMTCTTFNILAPIYKRLNLKDPSCRESQYRAYWLARNQRILDLLLNERSSVICLQEFWVGNEELVNMYEKRLGDANYAIFKLGRTNNRGDGLMTALSKEYFRVLNYRELFFNDCGDRVAQLLHVELNLNTSECRVDDLRQEILIVNTHLIFPHDSSLCLVRLHQVYKLLQYVESYQKEHNLKPIPIILCGDWNGSKRGHVYNFLRSLGFVSSYDTAHSYADADAHKWISHRNHRGNICGVDFIWLLNPNGYRELLKTSWSGAVISMLKYLLWRSSLTERDAFAFLKANSQDYCITYASFCEALKQQRIWNPAGSKLGDEMENDGSEDIQEQTIGFSVKNAVLFPPEAEKGQWPEDYSLSDHARLTVVFSPIRMPCATK